MTESAEWGKFSATRTYRKSVMDCLFVEIQALIEQAEELFAEHDKQMCAHCGKPTLSQVTCTLCKRSVCYNEYCQGKHRKDHREG